MFGFISKKSVIAEIEYLLADEYQMEVLSFSKMEKCRAIGQTQFGTLLLKRLFNIDAVKINNLRERNQRRAEQNLMSYKTQEESYR